MTEDAGGFSRFLRELKRRNVVRVAAVYAAVGFMLIEVVQAVFPALLLPEWTGRAVVVLVLLGFPITLVVAWAFELTPEGIRRTEDAAAEPPGAAAESTAGAGRTAAGPDAAVVEGQSWIPLSVALVVAGMLVVGGAVWWFTDADGASPGDGPPLRRGAGGSGGSTAFDGTDGGPPLVHLAVALPEGDSLVSGPGSSVAVSPDGRRLAYAAVRRDTSRLYLRPLDAAEAEPIPGTEGARAPFFSPDGAWVAFFADGELRKVSLEGGAPLRVADHPWPGGSWGPDDTLTVGRLGAGGHRGLSRVSADGGTPRPVTDAGGFLRDRPEQAHIWPHVLPGRRKILYTSWNLPGDMRVALHDLDTGESSWLLDPGAVPRYVGDGRLVYWWDGGLLAVAFDPEKGEVSSSPVPVLDGVAPAGGGAAHFDVSRTGTLVRVRGGMGRAPWRLAWVDASGEADPLPYEPRPYMAPRVAPDGRRFVAGGVEDGASIWLFDPERGASRRLTEPGLQEFWPIWSPDGRDILHNSNRHGGPTLDIYRRGLDGGTPPGRLTDGPGVKQPRSWTPGGDTLVFTLARERAGEDPEEDSGFDIWILPLRPESRPEPWLRTSAHESHPVVSPDGRWIAYASDISGRAEVYVRRFPGPGGEEQVSTAGGWEPVWAPGGDRLYYRSMNGDSLWAVSFRAEESPAGGTGPLPRSGRPELLFTGAFNNAAGFAGRNYDLAPDGERFLMILEGTEERGSWIERTRIDVILNWLPEMERRMAAASGAGG